MLEFAAGWAVILVLLSGLPYIVSMKDVDDPLAKKTWALLCWTNALSVLLIGAMCGGTHI